MTKTWTEPRRPPDTVLPAIAGTMVVFLALPVFLIQGWRIEGWALGAFLWLASQAFGFLLHRLHARTDNLAAAGVTAFGMMFRAIAVMVVLIAVAVSHPRLGLTAALLYALAYTMQLGVSLVTFFAGEAKR